MVNSMEVISRLSNSSTRFSTKFVSLNKEGRLVVEGGTFQGTWRNGKLADGRFIFKDELPYKKIDSSKEWEYCSAHDPR